MISEVKLNQEMIREIERILSQGRTVEMAIRSGKIILWSVNSKKKYELPIA